METFDWDIIDDHSGTPRRTLSMTEIQRIDLLDSDSASSCESPSPDEITEEIEITATFPEEPPKYRYEYTYSVDHYIAEHVSSKVSIGPHLGHMPLQESGDYDIDGAILKLNTRYIKKHIWTPLLFATCLLVKALEVSSADLGPLIGTL